MRESGSRMPKSPTRRDGCQRRAVGSGPPCVELRQAGVMLNRPAIRMTFTAEIRSGCHMDL